MVKKSRSVSFKSSINYEVFMNFTHVEFLIASMFHVPQSLLAQGIVNDWIKTQQRWVTQWRNITSNAQQHIHRERTIIWYWKWFYSKVQWNIHTFKPIDGNYDTMNYELFIEAYHIPQNLDPQCSMKQLIYITLPSIFQNTKIYNQYLESLSIIILIISFIPCLFLI